MVLADPSPKQLSFGASISYRYRAHAMTWGTLVLGVINGLTIGLLSVGFVMVYRANRFLNLAHAQLGALSALLMAKVVNDWQWGWWQSFVGCIAVGVITALLVEKFTGVRGAS